MFVSYRSCLKWARAKPCIVNFRRRSDCCAVCDQRKGKTRKHCYWWPRCIEQTRWRNRRRTDRCNAKFYGGCMTVFLYSSLTLHYLISGAIMNQFVRCNYKSRNMIGSPFTCWIQSNFNVIPKSWRLVGKTPNEAEFHRKSYGMNLQSYNSLCFNFPNWLGSWE